MAKFFTNSPKMKQTQRLVERAAKADVTVLIFGERGAGKSACARRIHANSPRVDRPFVEVSSLLVGASNIELKDKFDLVSDGTLYISEISYLNRSQQEELLLELSNKSSFRLISSSSDSFIHKIKLGEFSEELYSYISVSELRVPALRERKEDIPHLVDIFLENCIHKFNVKKVFSKEAIDYLCKKTYVGNVEELEALISYAYSRSSDSIDISDFEVPIWFYSSSMISSEASLHDRLYKVAIEILSQANSFETFGAFEQYRKLVLPPLLTSLLDYTKGNRSQGAKILGINRNTLTKLIREYEIEE